VGPGGYLLLSQRSYSAGGEARPPLLSPTRQWGGVGLLSCSNLFGCSLYFFFICALSFLISYRGLYLYVFLSSSGFCRMLFPPFHTVCVLLYIFYYYIYSCFLMVGRIFHFIYILLYIFIFFYYIMSPSVLGVPYLIIYTHAKRT
jgi:hypothetical protein